MWKSEPVDACTPFDITGEAPARFATPMVAAPRGPMNGIDGWRFEAVENDRWEFLIALPPARESVKLRGLTFFGVQRSGQVHHLRSASDKNRLGNQTRMYAVVGSFADRGGLP
jgi:hypothetical protein